MVLCPSLCNSTPCFVHFQNLQQTTVRRSHSRRALTSCPCMDESNCKSPHSSCCQKAMPAWGDFCVARLSSVTAAPLLTKLQFLVFQKNHRPHRSSEGWRNYEGGSFFFCWGGFFLVFWGFWFCLFVRFFQRNSHSYAVTRDPYKTLVLQRSSPGHCCFPASVRGRD